MGGIDFVCSLIRFKLLWVWFDSLVGSNEIVTQSLEMIYSWAPIKHFHHSWVLRCFDFLNQFFGIRGVLASDAEMILKSLRDRIKKEGQTIEPLKSAQTRELRGNWRVCLVKRCLGQQEWLTEIYSKSLNLNSILSLYLDSRFEQRVNLVKFLLGY